MKRKIIFIVSAAAVVLLLLLLRQQLGLRDFHDVVIIVEGVAGHYEQVSLTLVLTFITIYAVAAILVFPSLLLTLAGGFLFGVWAGTLVNLVGATLGAGGCFLLSRRFGGRVLPSYARQRILQMETRLRVRDFRAVVILRLTPFVPYSGINYGLGLTAVPLGDFIAGTFFGLLPKVLLGTILGAAGGALVA